MIIINMKYEKICKKKNIKIIFKNNQKRNLLINILNTK